MASDWANGDDLAAMSRGGNVLQQLGYDPDEVRANPALRAEVMSKIGSPYAPTQVAQNTPPPPIQRPNPQSQNGNDIAAPAGQPRLFNRAQPQAAPQPPPTSLGSATPTGNDPAIRPAPVSASVAPSGTTTPGNISAQNSEAAQADLLGEAPEAPDTSGIDATIAAKTAPLNVRTIGPGGKPLYKEGIGGKIGRGFKAAAVGFARGGVPASIGGAADPSLVGETPYGAPNSDYQIDDATRKGQLAQAQVQKTDMVDDAARKMAAFKTMVDARDKAGTVANVAAKLPNETTTANADAVKAEAAKADAYNKSPEGRAESEKELNAQTLADRTAQIKDPKNPLSTRSPADKAYYAATGKLPDPDRFHAPVEQLLVERAAKAWSQDPANKGKNPTVADVQSWAAAAKGIDPTAKTRSADTEKEYMAAQKDLGGQFAAAQTQNESLRTAQQEIASGAVGQALGTIKTLVGLSGGKGTGVRITQAELDAIAKARGIAGSFEGYVNGLEGKGKLSSAQITEIQGLLGDVGAKVKEKMALQDSYLDKLSAAKSVDEIRGVQSQYRKEFTGDGGASSNLPPPGAKVRDYTHVGAK